MKSRLVSISGSGQKAWIYPEHGFQLFGYEKEIKGRNVPVIYVPDMEREPVDRRYGNPILFPAPSLTCSSKGKDKWVWKDVVYPMPSHGFARNLYWHVLDVKSNSVTAELIPNSSSMTVFPFDFKLITTYRLDSAGLVLDVRVENPGKEAFPYALGFHPYLTAPLGGKGGLKDCKITVPRGTRLRSDDGWVTFEKIPSFGPVTFTADDGKDFPKTVMVLETGAKALELEDTANGLVTCVSVEGSEQSLPVWAVWSGSADAPYVCLEPWSDYPHALGRSDIRMCPPGGKHNYQMVISLREKS